MSWKTDKQILYKYFDKWQKSLNRTDADFMKVPYIDAEGKHRYCWISNTDRVSEVEGKGVEGVSTWVEVKAVKLN